MPKKHLNAKQIKELSDMLSAGKTNAEVAAHFKVSVATVNNHRTRLRREGVKFPSKRGRKPKSAAAAQSSGKTQLSQIKSSVMLERYNFIINGVSITISDKAKNVHIGKESMVINF